MTRFTLPEKAVTVCRIRLLILMVPICFILGGVFVFSGITALILFGVFSAVDLGIWFWLIPRHLQSVKILLEEGALRVERGIFIQSVHRFPLKRLIYAEKWKLPLDRMFGLCGIRLNAARGNLIIGLFLEEDGDRILEYLRHYG